MGSVNSWPMSRFPIFFGGGGSVNFRFQFSWGVRELVAYASFATLLLEIRGGGVKSWPSCVCVGGCGYVCVRVHACVRVRMVCVWCVYELGEREVVARVSFAHGCVSCGRSGRWVVCRGKGKRRKKQAMRMSVEGGQFFHFFYSSVLSIIRVHTCTHTYAT